MKALSVRQPWAWAILRAGKNIENRTRSTSHRGLLLIHASRSMAATAEHQQIEQLAHPLRIPPFGRPAEDTALKFGAIIGAVNLDRVHTCDGSCSPWAWPDATHWVVSNPIVLTEHIDVPGRLGVWDVPVDIADRVRAAMPR
ncbi:ASCH domain-containing protein [Nocardioides bruguierae]|uniref:ASCH domain-containing protein n=1 Tax=Nocardioides bruguierae TaxID=2945102 RepID=A0A9X2D5Q8_9ACTN|nr:ASCH domain-containing protein [Nocardioides bruguierae]MCM0619811.1 ASCH domain-containing protein [Nocardioides bruguierae]